MRRGVTIHDVVALLHEVAFLHRDVLAFRHRVFERRHTLDRGFDADTALVLVVLAKAHIAINFGDDRVVFGTTGFEQLGHPRQTAGDILDLGAFARNPRHHITRVQHLPVFHRKDGIDRHRVADRVAGIVAHRQAGGGIDHDDLGLQIVAARHVAPVGHDLLRHPGGIVGFVAHGDTRDEIDEFRHPRLFGNDRQGVGVPFEQLGAALDLVAVFDKDLGAVDHLVARALFALIVQNRNLHVAPHHDLLAALVE